MDRSNSSRVTLTSVNFNTSGTFRCEVSADAPDFQTVHKRANMTIFRAYINKYNVALVQTKKIILNLFRNF